MFAAWAMAWAMSWVYCVCSLSVCMLAVDSVCPCRRGVVLMPYIYIVFMVACSSSDR